MPAGLVAVHVALAATVWALTVRFYLGLSVRPDAVAAGARRDPVAGAHRRVGSWLGRGKRSAMTAPAPVQVNDPEVDEVTKPDRPWIVIVWNDPINLMSYVTFVLQKLFGYTKAKATKLMLDVHYKGKAVVSSGSREKAEMDVFRLHEHGLWATMEHSG